MARATMAALIAKVRMMVNEPISPTQRFTDDQVQDVLDANRQDVRQLTLTPADTIAPGGVTQRKDWFAEPGGAWESDVVLQDGAWNTLTPATSELLIGMWHFAASQAGPVFATGRLYDMNAAAADMIEQKMAQVAEEFDFSADGASYSRSQKLRGLLSMRDVYRGSQRVTSIPMIRTDAR